MKWKQPPLNKVYEALGTIGDGRIELDGNSAKVYSSSGNKFYEVHFNPDENSISSNDNGSFWQGYLGYPAIAFLLANEIVHYDSKLADYLKGFAWKDINQKFKNDFDKTDAYIDEQVAANHEVDLERFHHELEEILEEVMKLDLEKASGKRPPAGY